ncbi:cellulase family glycosylhydrolase [Mycobacterium sp. BMJ-28]
MTVLTSALFCGAAGQLFTPPVRAVSLAIAPVVAIGDAPGTVGIADSNLTNLSTTDIDAELAAMQSLGVKNVRISIPWAGIEATQGNFDWDTVDYIVQQATGMNMGILGVLSETPAWAGTPYLAGMPDPDVFATFAQQVATRYVGKISTYEIWNEPNAINFLDPVDPAGYTALLQAAYPVIKAVDANITVIGAVVGAGLSEGNAAMNPVDFVQGMYTAGAHGYFDALSFHPYDYTLDFSEGSSQAGSPLKQLQQILQLMATYGDGGLKVWATEYGEPTTSQYSEQQQADFLQDFLDTWPTIAGTGPMFLYTLRDTDSGQANPTDNLGLYYTNWDPKQALQVVADYIASLGPGPTDPPTPGNPVLQAISTAVQWLATAARSAVHGVASAAKNLVQATATVVRTVVQAVGKAIGAGVRFAASVVRGVVQGIAQATANMVNGIKRVIHPAASSSVPASARAVPAGAAPAQTAGGVATETKVVVSERHSRKRQIDTDVPAAGIEPTGKGVSVPDAVPETAPQADPATSEPSATASDEKAGEATKPADHRKVVPKRPRRAHQAPQTHPEPVRTPVAASGDAQAGSEPADQAASEPAA